MGLSQEMRGERAIDLEESLCLENESEMRSLLAVAHAYQPPREFLLLSQVARGGGGRANIVGHINERIYDECYRKIFLDAEKLPAGVVTSFYGTLREWIKVKHPEAYPKIVEKLWSLGNEAPYQVMGDFYLHLIMPLESVPTQDMLTKIGLRAYQEDLGFTPKGMWLPEAAVDLATLTVLARNGVEYVILRDSQITGRSGNPVYVKIDDAGENRRIAVVTVDSGISGEASFRDEVTRNADDFLNRYPYENITYATDMEFYGHHRTGKDKFLATIMNNVVQARHAIVPFSIRRKMAFLSRDPKYANVVEHSSWSCETDHKLGRWTGDPVCACDSSTDLGEKIYKRKLFMTLKSLGAEVDRRLDMMVPNWRDLFVEFFLATRKSMYMDGDIEYDTDSLSTNSGFEVLRVREIRNLFYAELSRLTGMTSCFNFFAGNDRPERQIAKINIQEICALVPGIDTVIPSDEAVWQSLQERLGQLGRW